MKFLPSQLVYLLAQRDARRNLRGFAAYVMVLVATIVVYSLLFHVIMDHEGQEHSWLTGFYWTFTVMSTLGFGDITFHSDLGRAFSVLVMLSGIILLLIVRLYGSEIPEPKWVGDKKVPKTKTLKPLMNFKKSTQKSLI